MSDVTIKSHSTDTPRGDVSLPLLEIYDFESILEAGILRKVQGYFRFITFQTLMSKQLLFVYSDTNGKSRLNAESDPAFEQRLDSFRIITCSLIPPK